MLTHLNISIYLKNNQMYNKLPLTNIKMIDSATEFICSSTGLVSPTNAFFKIYTKIFHNVVIYISSIFCMKYSNSIVNCSYF